ncbi:hypothetical protein NDU88_000203 [Pleurodeles waltl]|uniref:Uncharacterized protein n=1 Tax=Pleurodeles waltl TaxID=8319 RepID=A0AAV7USF6_PLEWA|nr:hypothetical protein NDU88_000203 [Pleurodeles waltl]
MGLYPPRVILAWRGGGAAYALAAVPLQRRGAAWPLGSRDGSGAGQRASWPLRRSGGEGPLCRTAPQAELVRLSGPRGRCASGGVGPHGRTALPAAHGLPALCLWRRGAAWPHGTSGGAWPPCPPTGGAGRRSAASLSTRNEVRPRVARRLARASPRLPLQKLGALGNASAPVINKKKKKKGGKRAITAARRRA